MPNLTLKCSTCESPMWGGKTSKSDGTQMCQECRRKRREAGVRNCMECGIEYPWRKTPRCSPCQFAKQKAKAAAKGSCSTDGCGSPQFCKGMCKLHYWRNHNAENPITRRYTGDCAHCGETFESSDPRTKHCSVGCGVTATTAAREATKAANRAVTCTDICVYNAEQVQWVAEMQSLIREMRIAQGKVNYAKYAKSKRSPMRRAYEDGDMPGLIEAIKAESRVTENGCWEWGRRKDRRGYGKVQWAGKNHAVHRLAALAKYGQPESEPVVHHKCANAPCCNPDHLQPISQRENLAEMLERNYYLRRIKELEAALQAVDPHNSVLSPLALSA